MGIGDWGLGIGDWGLGPIPNPQSPIPNPHNQNELYIIDIKKYNEIRYFTYSNFLLNMNKIIIVIFLFNFIYFFLSLAFFDNFMHVNENVIYSKIKRKFNGINNEYEMNGGRDKFRCKELEVFQLL